MLDKSSHERLQPPFQKFLDPPMHCLVWKCLKRRRISVTVFGHGLDQPRTDVNWFNYPTSGYLQNFIRTKFLQIIWTGSCFWDVNLKNPTGKDDRQYRQHTTQDHYNTLNKMCSWNTEAPCCNNPSYSKNKGHGCGHKAIDPGVVWKGIISRVCIPNMKSFSLMVKRYG